MNKEEIQQKYVQLQILDNQIKEMQKQMQAFEAQSEEIKSTVQGLDDFKEIEQGTSVLVPISSGIFAKAKLGENKDLLMNVGSGVVVKKSLDDVTKLLLTQVSKLRKLLQNMAVEINKLASKALPLQEEINEFIESEKQGGLKKD